MLTLPTNFCEICAPLFDAIPFDRAMPELKGAYPKETKLVEQILQHPALVSRPDLAAGLWLYVDDLDRSHSVSQAMESVTGDYWHGIMHRREGDYWNSHYWIRRASSHPLLQCRAGFDPHDLIDQVENSKGQPSDVLVTRQREEWRSLFEWCAANP